VSVSLDDKCVRCGACLAVCPVYAVTLKERFSPRGKNYLLKRSGIDRQNPLFIETIRACLQCGACTAVCTSGADVRSLIREERHEHGFFRTLPGPVYSLLVNRALSGMLVKAAAILPADRGKGRRGKGVFRNFLDVRNKIEPAEKSFLSQAEKRIKGFARLTEGLRGGKELPRTALFVGCVQDLLFPQIPSKMAALAGKGVIIPKSQTCCGLPAFSAGAEHYARKTVIRNLQAFGQEDFQVLLTGCASCASMIKKWPGLFEKGSDHWQQALSLSEKVMEFSRFALEFLPPMTSIASEGLVAFQMPCHQRYDLKHPADPLKLLERNLGGRFVSKELGCCGQGGVFAFSRPDVSGAIFDHTLSRLAPGVNFISTTCSGCLLRLRLGIDDRKITACHVVDTMIPDINRDKQ